LSMTESTTAWSLIADLLKRLATRASFMVLKAYPLEFESNAPEEPEAKKKFDCRLQARQAAMRRLYRHRVCTENSIRVDHVSESLNLRGDDRSLLPLPGPVRLAIQVERPTCGRERGAPTSVDHIAAEGAWPRPAYGW